MSCPAPSPAAAAAADRPLSDYGELLPVNPSADLRLFRCHNGLFVRLSRSAYALLEMHQDGHDLDAIGERFGRAGGGVNAAVTRAALATTLARIDAVAAKARPTTYFSLQWTLLPAGLVRWLSGGLTWLIHPVVASAAVLVCLPVVALALDRPAPPITDGASTLITFGLAMAVFLFHELGHAAASQRFGAPPSRIGMGVYLVFPALFSDVTAAWQLRRAQRVAVNVAGVYFQLLATAGVAIAHAWTGWGPLLGVCWVSVAAAAFSLNPILKLDGYWIVSDALGVSNLSREPSRVVRRLLGLLTGRASAGPTRPRWLAAVLVVYTAASYGFWIWFLVRLGPALGALIGAYPQLVARAFRAGATAGAVLDLVVTSLIAASLVVMILGLIRAAARRLAALIRWSSSRRPQRRAPAGGALQPTTETEER